MLRMHAVQVEQLWDEVLPVQVRVLPADLEVIDRLLDDPAVLGPRARGGASPGLLLTAVPVPVLASLSAISPGGGRAVIGVFAAAGANDILQATNRPGRGPRIACRAWLLAIGGGFLLAAALSAVVARRWGRRATA